MGHKRLEPRVGSMDKNTPLHRWILPYRSSVSLLPDCLHKLVFAVLIITGSRSMGLRQEYQQHGILFEFLEIVQNGLMPVTR